MPCGVNVKRQHTGGGVRSNQVIVGPSVYWGRSGSLELQYRILYSYSRNVAMYSLRSLQHRQLQQADVLHWRPTQRRWARVSDVRLVGTRGHFHPVVEKYRAKLDRKAKA